MTFVTAETLRNLRFSIMAAILLVALGAGLVAFSNSLRAAEERELKKTQARTTEIKTRLSKARDEEMEIRDKLALFDTLQARGILGEEERLDWVEQIRRIKSERKLYDIQYEIAPQRPLGQSLLPGSGGSFEFYSSTMQLKMDLLHEEDLVNFLEDFRKSVHAYVRVDRCTMERTARNGGLRTGPQLKAECALDLITARERKSA